jgi:hypothetical protein
MHRTTAINKGYSVRVVGIDSEVPPIYSKIRNAKGNETNLPRDCNYCGTQSPVVCGIDVVRKILSNFRSSK